MLNKKRILLNFSNNADRTFIYYLKNSQIHPKLEPPHARLASSKTSRRVINTHL